MVKASVAILVVLTVLIALTLDWRERRMAARQALPPPPKGWLDRQKRRLDRWVTAAALGALGTILILGGLHWLRVAQG